jgi:hypothetical protein
MPRVSSRELLRIRFLPLLGLRLHHFHAALVLSLSLSSSPPSRTRRPCATRQDGLSRAFFEPRDFRTVRGVAAFRRCSV